MKAAAVEHTVRIKGRLELAVDAHEHGVEFQRGARTRPAEDLRMATGGARGLDEGLFGGGGAHGEKSQASPGIVLAQASNLFTTKHTNYTKVGRLGFRVFGVFRGFPRPSLGFEW